VSADGETEEVILLGNKRSISRFVPGSAHPTAIEAMGDLYQTLPEEAGQGWLEDRRTTAQVDDEARDPWG
jgi:hypothetical protein